MSSTQIELGRIDSKALVAAFYHNMSVGRDELRLFHSEDSIKYKEMHLNKAKYHFMNAIRNAQGTINSRSAERINFNNQKMITEAVTELCGTLSKSIVINWKDSMPVLNITEVHTYDPRRRQEYRVQDEFSLISSIDRGGLSRELKQMIAAQVCECIRECFNGYTIAEHKRLENGISDIKEIQVMSRLAWHYGLTAERERTVSIWLMTRGVHLDRLEKLIYG